VGDRNGSGDRNGIGGRNNIGGRNGIRGSMPVMGGRNGMGGKNGISGSKESFMSDEDGDGVGGKESRVTPSTRASDIVEESINSNRGRSVVAASVVALFLFPVIAIIALLVAFT
jgi:hypothetical protein